MQQLVQDHRLGSDGAWLSTQVHFFFGRDVGSFFILCALAFTCSKVDRLLGTVIHFVFSFRIPGEERHWTAKVLCKRAFVAEFHA